MCPPADQLQLQAPHIHRGHCSFQHTEAFQDYKKGMQKHIQVTWFVHAYLWVNLKLQSLHPAELQ